MASSLNKVMLIGRLGRDPELRYTQSGKPVAKFSMATDESFSDREGNRTERTEWHNIVVWDRQGENCANYLRKGSLVYIEGRLQTRKWQDQQGNNRWSTEIVAHVVNFLDTKGSRDTYESQDGPPAFDDADDGGFPPPPGQRGGRPPQGGYQGGQGYQQGGQGYQGGQGGQTGRPPQQQRPPAGQPPRRPQPAPQPQQDEDLGPAFPSEASGMDDVPF